MKKRFHYSRVDKYLVKAELTGPMHVGSSEGGIRDVLIHPSTRMPFIQASSITGAIRDYYEREFGDAEKLFGSFEGVEEEAVIKVTDGEISAGKGSMMEFRPRVQIDPVSGTVASSKKKGSGKSSGNKFDMEYVASGSLLSFAIYVYGNDRTDEKIEEKILSCFSAMHAGEIILGGQKSNGCGNVEISQVLHRKYDLRSADDRNDWIDEMPLKEDRKAEDLANRLSNTGTELIRITVQAKTEGSILVKGYQMDSFGKNAPDVVNIKNGQNDYIVPGASVKGAVRSRAEYIAKCMNLSSETVFRIFGSDSGDENGMPGNARFYDTVIGDCKKTEGNSISNRIHIDKFTGGVINRALFKEKTAAGSVAIRIDIAKKGNQEGSAGLILLALRDLALGQYNLGGGYHIGRGFLDVSEISISKGNETSKIFFGENRKTEDKEGLLARCLAAVGKEA